MQATESHLRGLVALVLLVTVAASSAMVFATPVAASNHNTTNNSTVQEDGLSVGEFDEITGGGPEDLLFSVGVIEVHEVAGNPQEGTCTITLSSQSATSISTSSLNYEPSQKYGNIVTSTQNIPQSGTYDVKVPATVSDNGAMAISISSGGDAKWVNCQTASGTDWFSGSATWNTVTNAIIIITALFATTSTYAVIRYSTGKSVEDIKTYHQQADDTGDAEPPEEVKKGTNARDEP